MNDLAVVYCAQRGRAPSCLRGGSAIDCVLTRECEENSVESLNFPRAAPITER